MEKPSMIRSLLPAATGEAVFRSAVPEDFITSDERHPHVLSQSC